MAAHSEKVKGTDEDNIGPLQIFVPLPFVQLLHIQHRLVVAAPFGQVSSIRGLDLDIISDLPVVLHIDIQADTPGIPLLINAFLRFQILQAVDLNAQDDLQHTLTESRFSHDLSEKEIIGQTNVFPVRLKLFHKHLPLDSSDYALRLSFFISLYSIKQGKTRMIHKDLSAAREGICVINPERP